MISRPRKSKHFPPAMLWAYAALIGASLVLVGWNRLTGGGATSLPLAAAADVRSVVFTNEADGSIHVHMLKGGRELGVVAAGEDGFVRSTLRGINRERKRFGTDPGGALELIRRIDGSLTLNDPSTHIEIDLGAFGPSNIASFAAFMTPADDPRQSAGGAAKGAVSVAVKAGSAS